jgi:hypothetical protein
VAHFERGGGAKDGARFRIERYSFAALQDAQGDSDYDLPAIRGRFTMAHDGVASPPFHGVYRGVELQHRTVIWYSTKQGGGHGLVPFRDSVHAVGFDFLGCVGIAR